jgi:secreted trypsin-like serine protease
MKKIILCLIVFLSIMAGSQNAIAVKGGDSAIGDSRVVALIEGQTNNRASCSGALLTPKIVVSAAHCLRNQGMTYGSEIYVPSNLWVSQPGVDLNIDDTSKRVKVVQVILTNGYANIWIPESNNFLTQKDDIAFFFLAAPLVENYSIEIASEEEIRSIKNNQLIFTHFGYGQQDLNITDGKPYSIQLKS